MKNEVIKAIEQGAVGISSGPEYTPGSFASTEELIELCKAAPSDFAFIQLTCAMKKILCLKQLMKQFV